LVGVVLCDDGDDLLAERELETDIFADELLRCVPLEGPNELPWTSEVGLYEDTADALLDCGS